MVKYVPNSGELIRNVIDGRNTAHAKKRLVAMGATAVRPILDAMVGNHGRIGNALPELVDTLEKIAKKDVAPLLKALKDHAGLNIVVWALGHGGVKRGIADARVHRALRRLRNHEDGGIRSVSNYHLARMNKGKKESAPLKKRQKKKPAKTRQPKNPPTRSPVGPKRKKRVAVDKNVVTKKKATAKKRVATKTKDVVKRWSTAKKSATMKTASVLRANSKKAGKSVTMTGKGKVVKRRR